VRYIRRDRVEQNYAIYLDAIVWSLIMRLLGAIAWSKIMRYIRCDRMESNYAIY
jgi:hypothetical protein